MTQKRFTFFKDTVATNLKTPIVYNNEKMSIGEVLEMLNNLYDKNKQLEHQLLDLSEELDYYKAKCASLETGYIQEQDENWKLEKSKMEFANELGKTIDENEQLKSENKRLTDKLNKTALELVDECISQGKATEISEMSYREFLDYRAENGKPMELHL